jgi:hypothetical protein
VEAIIAETVFCAFALGLYIFDHTKAGKKFFDPAGNRDRHTHTALFNLYYKQTADCFPYQRGNVSMDNLSF